MCVQSTTLRQHVTFGTFFPQFGPKKGSHCLCDTDLASTMCAINNFTKTASTVWETSYKI